MPQRLPVFGAVRPVGQIAVDILQGGFDAVEQVSELLEGGPGEQDVIPSQAMALCQTPSFVRTLAVAPTTEAGRSARPPREGEGEATPGAPAGGGFRELGSHCITILII
jgi:hypothetical protein